MFEKLVALFTKEEASPSQKNQRSIKLPQAKCPKTQKMCVMATANHEISMSFTTIGCELCSRKLKKERYGMIAALGLMLGFLPFLKVFFLSNLDFTTLINILADPRTWVGITVLFISYAFYKVYYEKAKEKFDNLREEVNQKLWIEPCTCWAVCDHKEEFLLQMFKLGIKLYWK